MKPFIAFEEIKPISTEKKPWGKSELLFYSPFFQLNRIFVDRGWRCSLHYHKHKENFFYVFDGKLAIRQYRNILGKLEKKEMINGDYISEERYLKTSENLLIKSKSMSVPSLCLHQFQSLTEVVAMEWYIPSIPGVDISLEDIIRVSEINGKKVE